MTREVDGETGRLGDRASLVTPSHRLPVSPSPALPVAPSPRRPVAVSWVSGVPVANLTEDEALAAIDKMITDGGAHYAAVVNAAKIVAANQDDKLKQILIDADL